MSDIINDKEKFEKLMRQFTVLSENEKCYVEGFIQAIVIKSSTEANKKLTA